MRRALPSAVLICLCLAAPAASQTGSSLTATDGLAELADDVTEIAPGTMIGFLPYSVLAG